MGTAAMWVINEQFDRSTSHHPTMRGKQRFRDALAALDDAERAAVLSLARRASERLGVPYVAVDVGQLEDEAWVVIECGDAQFCGFCQVEVGGLARSLVAAVERAAPR